MLTSHYEFIFLIILKYIDYMYMVKKNSLNNVVLKQALPGCKKTMLFLLI